VQIINK
nr:Chain A, Microtubule-associated protein tau [Homo sapiens]6LRA_C Chain C, VQIINK [Homo sapiens]